MEFDLEILLEAFSKAPKEALEYFKSLGVRIDNGDDLLKAIEEDAFYLSKIIKLELLLDIKSEIEKAIEDGTPFSDFKKNFREILSKQGYINDSDKGLDTNWRINLIYKQNIIKSYSAGRYEQSKEYENDFPYYLFYSVLDKTTTKECKFLDNKVIRIDDKDISKLYPPGHFQCRRIAVPVDEDYVIEKGFQIMNGSELRPHWNKPSFQKLPNVPFVKDMSNVPNEYENEFEKETI